MKKIRWILSAIAVAAVMNFGCADNEPNHPLLKKAHQSMRVGEYRNAELCYKKYLAKDPSAVFVHRELAELYDEHLEDYLLAAYHYKEVLRLSPEMPADQVRIIKGFVERCEQRYFNSPRKRKKVLLTDEQEIERLTAAYKAKLAEEQKKQEAELARLKKELETSAETEKKAEAAEKTTAAKTVDADKKETEKIEGKNETVKSAVSEKQFADSSVVDDKKIEKTAENKPQKDGVVKNTSDAAAPDSPIAAEKIVAEKTASVSVPAQQKVAAAPVKTAEIAEQNKTVYKYPQMENEKATVKQQPENKIVEYKVQKGDTFTHLSRRFYGSIRYYKKLMKYNNIENPNALRVGKVLRIPPLEVLKGEK